MTFGPAVKIGSFISTSWRDCLLNSILSTPLLPARVRAKLIDLLTHHTMGASVRINPRVFLGSWRGLTVGDDTFINYGCFFDLSAPITIGNKCDIGYQAMFITATHMPGSAERRAGLPTSAPIVIEDGTWIGARAIIMPGVTVATGCIVGSGSVVVKSTQPHGTYVGAPARLVD